MASESVVSLLMIEQKEEADWTSFSESDSESLLVDLPYASILFFGFRALRRFIKSYFCFLIKFYVKYSALSL